MLDSSAAIQPNKQVKIENKFIDVGNFLSYELIDKTIQIKTENSFVSILFYEKDIVRIVMNPNEVPSLKSSFGVIAHPNKEIYYHMEDRGNDLYIKSSQFLIIIRKYPLRITILDIKGRTIVRENSLGMAYTEENEVICFKEMDTRDNFYGFGEKTGYLNKRGEKMTMWNTDVYAPHNPETDALYQSIPYFITMRNGSAHGIFFDNTFKTVFDMKSSEDKYSFSAEGGQLDYYVLAGPTIKDVVMQYTFLSGRMPLPPKWSLGYHQSRYSYQDEWEVREIAETFREKEIPLDCIYLDIHYMNEYRVFTFDKNNFPNPQRLVSDLKAMGIKIVPIVDPGVKADPEYTIYLEGVRGDKFCKYIEGDIFFGEVWPGKSAFPDFTSSEVQTWWGDKHNKFWRE
ncbi:glycoside hydrolase family 31 protein [Sutcliffiella cohnii]